MKKAKRYARHLEREGTKPIRVIYRSVVAAIRSGISHKTYLPCLMEIARLIRLTAKHTRLRGGWDLIIAHPPCTWFSNATMVNLGRKDRPDVFNEAWRDRFIVNQKKAFDFFLKIWNCNCTHIACENVVGWLSTHFRKPTQIVQPYYFGEPYRKATCLWLYNLPTLKATDMVDPQCKWVRHHLKAKNDLDGYALKGVYSSKERSKTFEGIANAMAKQWGDYVANLK